MSNSKNRIIFGTLYAGLIIACLMIHPYAATFLIIAFMGLCVYEFITLTQMETILYKGITLMAIGIIAYLYAKNFVVKVPYEYSFYRQSLYFAPVVMFSIAALILYFNIEEIDNDFSKMTMAVAYIAVPFALCFTILSSNYHQGEITISNELLFIFVLIWLSDTLAYFIGSRWGKHKLAPKISPNKTWEGTLAGFIGCIIAAFVIEQWQPNLKGNFLYIGFIVALAAPIGDLVESRIKRYFGKKDSSNIIPGHGGFFDRLDSFIFVTPFVYLYYLILFGL